MDLRETEIEGAFLVEPERREDDRGFFLRTFDAEHFERRGLNPVNAQSSVSHNARRGTMRGLHYQVAPATETKYLRCTRGAIHDVIVDLRPDSPTFLHHVAFELTAENCRGLYVPEMVAHGFLTLEDDTDVAYQISEYYAPGRGRGLRYDDPSLGVDWPIDVQVVSEQDLGWPLLGPAGRVSS